MNRRSSLSLLAAAPFSNFITAANEAGIHIASNTYPWSTFAKRAGDKLESHSDALLGDFAECGFGGYEPIFRTADEADGLAEKLKRHELEMRSIYVNSTLHDEAASEKSIESVIAIADAVKSLGTKIVVTNPSPIQWGGDEAKTDAQLRFQAAALDELGGQLRERGMMLAYHNHDAELRHGAREFHHMLTATKAENVKFCLDAHWVFRGCGNSEVAVFDALSHYQNRVVELHLRQSENGIWTEAFTMDGDIDYARMFSIFENDGQLPHLVLEQSVEKKTPETLTVVEAHSRGFEAVLAGAMV